MEVILTKDVDKVGKTGLLVKVKEGFARNFLIPNGLAVPATDANLKKLKQQKEKENLALQEAKKKAQAFKERLDSLSLTISALTQEEDKLYGSVGPKDIADALKEEGFDIDKNFIVLDEPVKSLGIYEIPVKLHPEVSAKIKVWIVKK